jgi:hypothetical protein
MQKVLKELFDQFVKKNGREPDNLEMILIRQKASTEDIRKRKIISMFDRSPVDADKPILGGQNIQETDAQILERLNKGNEEGINRLKNKKDEPDDMATGGRAGYYGGGVAMVGEDLSEIGHGSDSLMARNMQLAPNGQATTSTGLNYLLGQDNDTVRVPYNEGNMVLPKPKPNADPMVELLRVYNLYQESMPGVSQDTKKYLQQDFIQKLNDAGISQEAFMTNRMQNNFADGGRAAFGGGGTMGASDRGYQGGGRNAQGSVSGTAPGAAPVGGGVDDRGSPTQNLNNYLAINAPPKQKQSIIDSIKNNRFINNPFIKGALRVGAYTYNPALLGTDLRTLTQLKGVYDNTKNIINNPSFEEEDMTLGIVSEQQQKEIDKAATMANAMNDKGVLTDIEKNTIFESVKPFDDKGSSGFYGLGATEPSPMTKQEFDTYIQEKGYAEGGPARQNFKMGKRAFLKLIGSGVAGIASLKTGLLDFTKGGGKKVAKEVVKEATGAPPAYFFKLVDKIKKLGDDAPKLAVKDKENVTTYKDYTLTEDITTGEQTIQRMKIDDDLKYDASEYYGKPVGEEVYMSYRPGKGLADETTKGKTPPDEYTEDTSLIRSDRPAEGEIMDTFDGVPDDLLEEVGETIVKKADGGRIGYAGGKKVVDAIIKKANKKLGKKVVTTADKAEIPKETLLRDMFTDTNKRLNKKREMTVDEYEDFVEEVGGADQLEAYNFDGTVGDAERILKEKKAYEKEMYQQYKMGKLDPEAGDKSPARKRFLEQKLADMEASGDSKLMTREEIEELTFFDLGTEMDKTKLSVNDEIKQGVADVLSDTSPAALEKSIEIDNLMLEYPGMDKNLADQIASASPIMKADMIAMVKQTFKMDEMGMSGDDIIQTFKDTTRTKQATGGLASILR